jgi:hypothetical protein
MKKVVLSLFMAAAFALAVCAQDAKKEAPEAAKKECCEKGKSDKKDDCCAAKKDAKSDSCCDKKDASAKKKADGKK